MKELNLVELLKDVPAGTKLYSPFCGEVELDDVDEEIGMIKFVYDDYYYEWVGKDGKAFDRPDAECILFPSKDNRDWSTFEVKKKPIYERIKSYEDAN